MKEIVGRYNMAVAYADEIEENALEQIQKLCNQSFAEGSRIRIMPDVHAGAGCVIGFTADLGDKVIPNIVGVDIGCGMLTVELGDMEIDFEKLDDVIRKFVPSGKNTHEGRIVRYGRLMDLNCYRMLKNTKRIERSIGTLGGGNHFIEIDCDENGNKYLVIHTGSRNLGKQVAEYYQSLAYDIMKGKDKFFEEKDRIIAEYKAAGRRKEIQGKIKELMKDWKEKEIDVPKELCYLTGDCRRMYLEDMEICQDYAALNRSVIAELILKNMFDKSPDDFESFETVHNYVDHNSNIIRKGAVSALSGEKMLIPINMRDGSLICVGKGNPEWNFSAPHGAGGLYSRSKANETFTVEEFKNEMKGIFTTSVNSLTLDECPMAYKDKNDIVKNIFPTAKIIKEIKPLYNFKAVE